MLVSKIRKHQLSSDNLTGFHGKTNKKKAGLFPIAYSEPVNCQRVQTQIWFVDRGSLFMGCDIPHYIG
jgi:hypothetical protein